MIGLVVEIKFHEFPHPEIAMYSEVRKIIYIHKSAEKYPKFLKILKDHELKHYNNNISNRPLLIKTLIDLGIDYMQCIEDELLNLGSFIDKHKKEILSEQKSAINDFNEAVYGKGLYKYQFIYNIFRPEILMPWVLVIIVLSLIFKIF